MSGSKGGITADGHSSQPGGGPLVVVPNPCGSNLLPLPSMLYDDLNFDDRRRLNMIQIEYARDVALLESRAYDAVLKLLMAPRED